MKYPLHNTALQHRHNTHCNFINKENLRHTHTQTVKDSQSHTIQQNDIIVDARNSQNTLKEIVIYPNMNNKIII